ncbi:MAG: GIN domain-containing protein [Cytophagales bacterium]
MSIDRISGSGNIASQTLALSSFTEIEVRNYCNMEVAKGTENKVEYSDYENIIQYLKFEVVGNRLIVKTIPENISISNSQAKAKVVLTGNLDAVYITGSADVDLLSSFNGLNKLSITGSGNIVSRGTTTVPSIDCSVTGSGNLSLLKINSTTAKCAVAGSGNITIAVSGSLNANIVGSGNIYYQGNPADIVVNVTGSGKVIKL